MVSNKVQHLKKLEDMKRCPLYLRCHAKGSYRSDSSAGIHVIEEQTAMAHVPESECEMEISKRKRLNVVIDACSSVRPDFSGVLHDISHLNRGQIRSVSLVRQRCCKISFSTSRVSSSDSQR